MAPRLLLKVHLQRENDEDYNSLAENQKGINAVQWSSVENQKGAITLDFVQQ